MLHSATVLTVILTDSRAASFNTKDLSNTIIIWYNLAVADVIISQTCSIVSIKNLLLPMLVNTCDIEFGTDEFSTPVDNWYHVASSSTIISPPRYVSTINNILTPTSVNSCTSADSYIMKNYCSLHNYNTSRDNICSLGPHNPNQNTSLHIWYESFIFNLVFFVGHWYPSEN